MTDFKQKLTILMGFLMFCTLYTSMKLKYWRHLVSFGHCRVSKVSLDTKNAFYTSMKLILIVLTFWTINLGFGWVSSSCHKCQTLNHGRINCFSLLNTLIIVTTHNLYTSTFVLYLHKANFDSFYVDLRLDCVSNSCHICQN